MAYITLVFSPYNGVQSESTQLIRKARKGTPVFIVCQDGRIADRLCPSATLNYNILDGLLTLGRKTTFGSINSSDVVLKRGEVFHSYLSRSIFVQQSPQIQRMLTDYRG